MTPIQALNILDRVCAGASASRQDHATMSQAIETLNDVIKKYENDVLDKQEEER